MASSRRRASQMVAELLLTTGRPTAFSRSSSSPSVGMFVQLRNTTCMLPGGMSVRDIAGHLTDLYGTDIGRDTISRVTDAAVLDDIEAWRNRPLAAVYPSVYFDCLMVRVREDRSVSSRAC